jgi:hypothetical protein
MLHHDVGQAAVRRDLREELLQRLSPPADAPMPTIRTGV